MDYTEWWQECGVLRLSYAAYGNVKQYNCLRKYCGSFLGKKKSKTHLPYDTAIPVLDIYPREMKAHVHTKACTWIFIAALFVINENNLRSVHKSISNM